MAWSEWMAINPEYNGETVSIIDPASQDIYNQDDFGVYHNRCASRPTGHDGAFARVYGTEIVQKSGRKWIPFKQSDMYRSMSEGPYGLSDEVIQSDIDAGMYGEMLMGHDIETAFYNEWQTWEEEEPTKTLLAATGHNGAMMCEKDRYENGEFFMQSNGWGLEWDPAAEKYRTDNYDDAPIGKFLIRFRADGCPDPEAVANTPGADSVFAIVVTTETEQLVFQSYYDARAYRRTRQ